MVLKFYSLMIADCLFLGGISDKLPCNAFFYYKHLVFSPLSHSDLSIQILTSESIVQFHDHNVLTNILFEFQSLRIFVACECIDILVTSVCRVLDFYRQQKC